MTQKFSKYTKDKTLDNIEMTNKAENIDFIGKVARFPKNVKASKAYSFLENIRINRNKIWYIIVEKQNQELQMLKYNMKAGVNLSQFIFELKQYYLEKYDNQPKLNEIVNNLDIYGEEKFVVIKNIPNVEIQGKSFITRLTEDLIKLLSV